MPDSPAAESAEPAEGAEPAELLSAPFVAGEGGYHTYRVPAAVVGPDGALLAFAEGRVGGAADTGHIDVVLRRSTDGGRSWGPLVLVAAGEGDTRGNASPVVDPASGRVVLLSCFNGGDAEEADIMRGVVAPELTRRVFVQISEDGGRGFSPPREITEAVRPPGWRWYATGPGHAVALTRGPHAGRLVVPANHSVAPPPGSADTGAEDRYYGGHALLSDDGGASWRLGFVDSGPDGAANANESTAAELPDGRLYLNCRDQHGTAGASRLDGHSGDGGETLTAGRYAPQPSLGATPRVQGSVLAVGASVLFSGPSDPEQRRAMALWRSDDGGGTFRPAATLARRPAAYSDLVPLGGDAVGVLYETGDDGPYERIELWRVPLRAR